MIDPELKTFISRLPSFIRVIFSLFFDGRVPLFLKTAAVAGIVYFFSPLDVIPDFLFGIGWVDDLILSLLVLQAFVGAAPKRVLIDVLKRHDLEPEDFHIDIVKGAELAKKGFKEIYQYFDKNFNVIVDRYSKKAPVPVGVAPEQE